METNGIVTIANFKRMCSDLVKITYILKIIRLDIMKNILHIVKLKIWEKKACFEIF